MLGQAIDIRLVKAERQTEAIELNDELFGRLHLLGSHVLMLTSQAEDVCCEDIDS